MSIVNLPTTYKFKIANIIISVNTGNFYMDKEKSAHTQSLGELHFQIPHYHALHELFLIGGDPLSIRTRDGSKEFSNCAVLMPAFLEHSTHGSNQMRLLFSFEKTDGKQTDFSNFITNICAGDKLFTAQIDSSLVFYMEEFEQLVKNNSEFCDDMATSVLKLIFYHIYKQSAKSKTSTKNSAAAIRDSYIIKIDTMVNDYQTNITLKTVADALCLSIKQTARIIKKNYNKTLSALLTERRLRVAAALLSEEKYSVADVVQIIHFSSERYFYYQFKKAYGCTPQEYKKLHANGHRELPPGAK